MLLTNCPSGKMRAEEVPPRALQILPQRPVPHGIQPQGFTSPAVILPLTFALKEQCPGFSKQQLFSPSPQRIPGPGASPALGFVGLSWWRDPVKALNPDSPCHVKARSTPSHTHANSSTHDHLLGSHMNQYFIFKSKDPKTLRHRLIFR